MEGQCRCACSHEMKNRLSVIVGNCDLMGTKISADSECAKRLSAIRESARGVVCHRDAF
jgi:hypothetical protein